MRVARECKWCVAERMNWHGYRKTNIWRSVCIGHRLPSISQSKPSRSTRFARIDRCVCTWPFVFVFYIFICYFSIQNIINFLFDVGRSAFHHTNHSFISKKMLHPLDFLLRAPFCGLESKGKKFQFWIMLFRVVCVKNTATGCMVDVAMRWEKFLPKRAHSEREII